MLCLSVCLIVCFENGGVGCGGGRDVLGLFLDILRSFSFLYFNMFVHIAETHASTLGPESTAQAADRAGCSYHNTARVPRVPCATRLPGLPSGYHLPSDSYSHFHHQEKV